MRRAAGLLLIAFALAACGSTGPPPPAAVRDVELKASDVPHGMARCGSSGEDVDTFLKGAPSNSDVATEIEQNWSAIKTMGVTKGVVDIYAATKADCTSLFTSASTASTPVVMCMTVQFKSVAQAANAFKQADYSASGLAALGAKQGTATGLTANSIALEDSSTGQNLYFGIWQNAHFLDLLLALGIALPAAERAAKNVNSRIH